MENKKPAEHQEIGKLEHIHQIECTAHSVLPTDISFCIIIIFAYNEHQEKKTTYQPFWVEKIATIKFSTTSCRASR